MLIASAVSVTASVQQHRW